MEFDKQRVYTAVNADELKVGSKVICADTVKVLRKKVQADDYAQYVQPFIRLYDNGYDVQFLADCYTYNYAYLIEPPAEPKYKPFEDFNNMADAVRKHGDDIKTKTGKCKGYIVGMGLKGHVIINGMFGLYYFCSTKELFKGYVFADDCSPCGELVEE